jgi:hypothetical protein
MLERQVQAASVAEELVQQVVGTLQVLEKSTQVAVVVLLMELLEVVVQE